MKTWDEMASRWKSCPDGWRWRGAVSVTNHAAERFIDRHKETKRSVCDLMISLFKDSVFVCNGKTGAVFFHRPEGILFIVKRNEEGYGIVTVLKARKGFLERHGLCRDDANDKLEDD